MIVNIVYDDSSLVIAPSDLGLEKEMHYTQKRLVPNPERPWERMTVFSKEAMFTVLHPGPGLRVIQTYAGMLDKVLCYFLNKGRRLNVQDRRQEFPAPLLHKMQGFRCRQRELLTDFLLKKRSGLLCAPTRYGKTTLIINTLRAYPGVTTVVTVPGADLVEQLYHDIKERLPKREVVLLGAGSRRKFPSDDITVCSMDSLHKCDFGKTRLLLIDEPHAAVTDSRLPEFAKFDMARKLGFGATLGGRYDGRDALITAMIGPKLVERTYRQAVEEGAIAPLTVIMLKVRFEAFRSFTRDQAYRTLLFRNEGIANITAEICRNVVPEDWQSIIFINNEAQAELFLKQIGPSGTIVMAKRMGKKERNERFEQMRSGDIKRCIATDIYATGVTFSDLKLLINACGGGGNLKCVQKPGRLAEIRPGKKCGLVLDFLFECENPRKPHPDKTKEKVLQKSEQWRRLVSDSLSRQAVYQDKGYEVITVDNFDDLRAEIQKRI